MYVECVDIHNCAKRKFDNITSNAPNNTYQLVVSVLDVPSISNTKKTRGIYLPDDFPCRRSVESLLTMPKPCLGIRMSL